MSSGQRKRGTLFPPRIVPNYPPEHRAKWLADARRSFVAPGKANHDHYAMILEILWPEGHGIPGPVFTNETLRVAFDSLRTNKGLPVYYDIFRRLRELQGDEGFKCIVKEGNSYQLQSLVVSEKKVPRSKPKTSLWKELLEKSDHACAKCGRKEPEVVLSPDHRRPRDRGGTGDDFNWQPLCQQCNVLKSAACKSCTRNCDVCFWAYPEDFSDLEISDQFRELLRRESEDKKTPQNAVLEEILRRHFKA